MKSSLPPRSLSRAAKFFTLLLAIQLFLIPLSTVVGGCCDGGDTGQASKKIKYSYGWSVIYGVTAYHVKITKTFPYPDENGTNPKVEITESNWTSATQISGDSRHIDDEIDAGTDVKVELSISETAAGNGCNVWIESACYGRSDVVGILSATVNKTIGNKEDLHLPAGAATTKCGSVRFALGTGDGFGAIWVEQKKLVMGSYSSAVLRYDADNKGEVIRIGVPPDRSIKQVRTPDCLAHVAEVTGGYEVRFFEPLKIGPKVNNLYTVTGGTGEANSFVTWRILNTGTSTLPKLTLTEYRPATQTSTDTTWEQTQQMVGEKVVTDSWVMKVNNLGVDRKTVDYDANPGDYVATIKNYQIRNGVEVLVRESKETYSGDKLVSILDGPAVGGVITTYGYDLGGNRIWMKRSSDGYWEKYGKAAKTVGDSVLSDYVVRPIGDLDFASGNETTGAVQWTRRGNSGNDVVSKYNNVIIGETLTMRIQTTDSLTSQPVSVIYHWRHLEEGDSGIYSETQTYSDNAIPALAGKPVLERTEEGMKREYIYEAGTLDSGLAFYPDPIGLDLRQTMTESDTESSDPIVGRSVRTVVITNAASQVRIRENYLYTAANTFSLLSREASTYDGFGNLTRINIPIPSIVDGRILSEAGFDASGRRTWEIDETGVRTEYGSFDSAGRPLTVVRRGFAGAGASAPAQLDRTTTLDYDVLGNKLSESVSDGTTTITSSWSYDTAGRIVSETVGGITTNYVYSTDPVTKGAIVTLSRFGGWSQISKSYCDRQIKSIGGTAAVARAYTYGLQDAAEPAYTHLLWTREEQGNPTIGYSTWSKTIRDWIGNVRLEEQQAPSQANTIRREQVYNSKGALAEEWLNGSRVYLIEENVLLNNRTETRWLSASASVVSTQTISVEQNGGWWRVRTTPEGVLKEQLSSFSNVAGLGWLTGRRLFINLANETSDSMTYIDRASKLVRHRQSSVGITGINESLIRNGLEESRTTPSVSVPVVMTYDGFGRLAQVNDPRTALVTSMTYNATFPSQVATQTLSVPVGSGDSAAGQSRNIVQTYYTQTDAAIGQLIGQLASRSENGVITNYSYTLHGKIAHVWGGTYPIQYKYDELDRRLELHTYRTAPPNLAAGTWPDGDKTTWSYHSGTNALSGKFDAASHGVNYMYDTMGRLSTRYAGQGVTNYDIDWLGQTRGTTYGGNATPFVTFSVPDSRGRYTQLLDAAGSHTLTYDAHGVLSGDSITLGILDGVSVSAGFGISGRPQSQTLTVGGAAAVSQSYGYDPANGRLITASDSGQTVSVGYTYVSNSDLVSGSSTSLNGVSKTGETRAFDNLNRLRSITASYTGIGTVEAHTYDYNSQGQRQRDTRSDGNKWAYGYNSRNEVSSGQRQLSDGTPVIGENFSYAYDAIGNRATATVNSRVSSYIAGNLNQYSSRSVPNQFDVTGDADASVPVYVNLILAARQGARFWAQVGVNNANYVPAWSAVNVLGFKAGGGGTSNDYARSVPGAGPNHVFTPPNPEYFTYDLDGNLTQDGRWTYTWDLENRLIRMETVFWATNVGVPYQKLEFSYDARGRRIEKRIYSDTSTVSKRYRYAYNLGWSLLAVLDAPLNGQPGGNTVKQSFLWGQDLSDTLEGAGGVGGLLTIKDVGSATAYRYAYDGNGNVIKLVNLLTGAIGGEYFYGPFGERLRSTGLIAEVNPFRFSTKYQDSETGLLYYGHRYYNAVGGRWLGRDRIGTRGSINSYSFLRNFPTGNVDVLGESGLINDVTVYGESGGAYTYDFSSVETTATGWTDVTAANDPSVFASFSTLKTFSGGAAGGMITGFTAGFLRISEVPFIFSQAVGALVGINADCVNIQFNVKARSILARPWYGAIGLGYTPFSGVSTSWISYRGSGKEERVLIEVTRAYRAINVGANSTKVLYESPAQLFGPYTDMDEFIATQKLNVLPFHNIGVVPSEYQQPTFRNQPPDLRP